MLRPLALVLALSTVAHPGGVPAHATPAAPAGSANYLQGQAVPSVVQAASVPPVVPTPPAPPIPPHPPAPSPPIPPAPEPHPTAIVLSDASTPVAPGTLVTLDARLSLGQSSLWITDTDPAMYRTDSGGQLVYFSGMKPGKYTFRYVTLSVVDGKAMNAQGLGSVVVVDPGSVGPRPSPVPIPSPLPTPLPSPPPGPVPSPTPVPALGHLRATLVFSLDEPSTAGLRVSTIKADLAALDCAWGIVQPDDIYARFLKGQVPTANVPVVFITTVDGRVVDMVGAPTKAGDVVAVVKRLRGVK